MTTANTAPITGLGELRRRQQAAKDRAELRIVSPEVRAARAALLDKRDASMAVEREEAIQKASRPVEVLKELFLVGSTEVLEEVRRSLPTLSTRQIGDIIGDVLTERRRAHRTADLAGSSQASGKPARVR